MIRPIRIALAAAFILAVFVIVTTRVDAHAVLKSSRPAGGSVVSGPDVPISLTFNVRVDASRSKLQLLLPNNEVSDLPASGQPSPDTLTTTAKSLSPGAYSIRWQVLAPDGHISRGEIPFTVKTPDGH